MNIYVANLSFAVQDEDLREFFTPYGEVTSAKVIMDKVSGRSRGFGFVEMSDDEAARKAIAELDGATVEGKMYHEGVGPGPLGRGRAGGGKREDQEQAS